MSVSRIADRYAKSLLDLAIEGGNLDGIMEDVQSFVTMLSNKDLTLMLKSPIISASKKEAIFKALFDGKVQPLTMTFFNVILRKGREMFLPEIGNSFVEQYKDYKGITDVTLITAKPVSEDILAEIKNALKGSDVTKETIEITAHVDEDLIGGYVLEIGDKLYDNSISHQLSELRKQFAQ